MRYLIFVLILFTNAVTLAQVDNDNCLYQRAIKDALQSDKALIRNIRKKKRKIFGLFWSFNNNYYFDNSRPNNDSLIDSLSIDSALYQCNLNTKKVKRRKVFFVKFVMLPEGDIGIRLLQRASVDVVNERHSWESYVFVSFTFESFDIIDTKVESIMVF